MDAVILHFQAPLMSFGGPQIDQIGPTGRFPTLSQIAGLLANALGYDHRDWDRTQALQDRLRIGSALVKEGRELPDYQTVDLGQEHLRNPGWTTRGRAEHRDGGPEARFGTHIRYRRYRADSNALIAVALAPADEAPTLEDLRAALDRPARPLFLGRKPCLPAAPVLVGTIETVEDLADALARVPIAFPDRWAEIARGGASPEAEIELPVADERTLPDDERLRTLRVIDSRDWRNRLHGGERVVLRRQLKIGAVVEEAS